MGCLEELTWGEAYAKQTALAGKPKVDVAARLRSMW
jgi:hypothetical protein